MMRKYGLMMLTLIMALVVGVVGAGAAGEALPALPIMLDFSDPTHVALIERPWDNLEYFVVRDPLGKQALLFPSGGPEQSPPAGAYPHMRFITLPYSDLDEFVLSVESLGLGGETIGNDLINGGNRSLALVFGYQDPANYWVAYFTYTNTTRVTQVVNGAGKTICQPNVAGVWKASNKQYQDAKIALETQGNNKVLRVWVNGEPTTLDGCTFAANQYKPGKVGIGGHPTDKNQAWYFSNVYLEAR